MENSPNSINTTERSDSGSVGQASGQPVVEQARQKAGEVVDQARQQIQAKLGDQKERAAEGLGQVADALRQTGQQLREHQQAGISQYAESAAAQVERFAGYLREQDIQRLVRESEAFARRQPALFLGGAFMLGFFLSRFLKSSSDGAGMAGSGAWDRAAWDRSEWYRPAAERAPGAAPAASGMGSSPAMGSSGADTRAPGHGAAMNAGSSPGTSGMSAASSPAASVSWSAADEEEDVDLAPMAGQSAQGGPTDDE